MHKVLLIGAGKIGSAIAKMLLDSQDYELTIVDSDPKALAAIKSSWVDPVPGPSANRLTTIQADVCEGSSLERFMEDKRAVISASVFKTNSFIATAALKCGLSYFDLTEDVQTTKYIEQQLGPNAADGQIFMPQCGLAPGFICIAANSLAKDFDNIDEIRMRVGALPRFPSNELKYNLSWSPDGLINEYCNPCEAIEAGTKVSLAPMEGIESLSIDGEEYEAFNTSGGLGTLCDTLGKKVSKLTYKTIRYPGHQKLMSFLLFGLRMAEHREMLIKIFKEAVPSTEQDVVITFVSAIGWKNGRLVERVDARKLYGRKGMTAIQTTTAAGMCVAVDLHFNKLLPFQKGFVKQECISIDQFLSNRFGRFYTDEEPIKRW